MSTIRRNLRESRRSQSGLELLHKLCREAHGSQSLQDNLLRNFVVGRLPGPLLGCRPTFRGTSSSSLSAWRTTPSLTFTRRTTKSFLTLLATTPEAMCASWPAPATLTHLAEPFSRNSRGTDLQPSAHDDSAVSMQSMWSIAMGQRRPIDMAIPMLLRNLGDFLNALEKFRGRAVTNSQNNRATRERTKENRAGGTESMNQWNFFFLYIFLLFLFSLFFPNIVQVSKPQTTPGRSCAHSIGDVTTSTRGVAFAQKAM